MKEKILKLLKENGGFLSGEEISNLLGVSRTAIWKHISALKHEGYVIESSSKKGYRLLETPDLLTPKEVLPLIKTEYIGKQIVHFDSIGSTNNIARTMALDGCAEGFAVIAEEQTEGRGRLGRKWLSPKASSVAFSLVLRPDIKPQDASKVTLVMGLAVCRAIESVTGLKCGIKWPNDIIINNRKVCGILTEMNAEIDAINYIIIGTGINVNVPVFPEEIRSIATSLSIELNEHVSRKEILSALLFQFESLYNEFKQNGLGNLIDEFKAYSVTIGRAVKVISINESFEGVAVDITDDGILHVKLPDGGIRPVISGDVSVRGLNGYV
jgi:BirA family biotin operon repressor/biotin-[acetyl-CoA-carboxylase] ligase